MKKTILTLLLLGICNLCYAEHLNYNTDVFDLSKGQKNYKCHTAHINYKNDRGEFEKIDTTLTLDTDKKWKESKASYRCSIPEYSDDWFEFYNAYEGANHTLKAKPVAGHIKGEYFTGKDGQGVIYRNAFGQDIDLKVYAYWGGLKKVICINKKPTDTSKDLIFDFELELPQGKDKVKDRERNIWNKTSKLDFKDKTLKIGEDGKESYFRNALLWDSKELSQSVDIELYKQSSKIFLRKTITKDILEKAFYPLYTDHPTSYYVGAGDGYIQCENANWDTAHDALAGTWVQVNIDNIYIASYIETNYFIDRGFFPVDTSGISDTATIDSAIFYFYVFEKGNDDNDGDDWINVVGQTSQADPTTLADVDFDQCGSINNPTEGAVRIDIGNITVNILNAWTFNGTGRGWIKKTAGDPYTMIGLREGHDCIDSAPVNYSYIGGYASETTFEGGDPYLDVTVSEGGASPFLPCRIKWN